MTDTNQEDDGTESIRAADASRAETGEDESESVDRDATEIRRGGSTPAGNRARDGASDGVAAGTRRRFLAAVSAGASVSLAGCESIPSDGDDPSTDTEGPDGGDPPTDTEEPDGDDPSKDTEEPDGDPEGMRVVDAEDPDPDPAIILEVLDVPISDWIVYGTETVADQNPAYDSTDRIVILAFERLLDQGWSDWRQTPPNRLFDGVVTRGIKFHAFPRKRLERT